MNIKSLNSLVLICPLFLTVNCFATDLLGVYKLAEKNDPTYLEEVAAYKATLEARPQAMYLRFPLAPSKGGRPGTLQRSSTRCAGNIYRLSRAMRLQTICLCGQILFG